MRTTLWAIGLFLALGFSTIAAQELLSEEAFADKVLSEFSAQAPDLEIRKAGYLHLQAVTPDEKELQIYLDNAYKSYTAYPDTRDAIIATYIAGWIDQVSSRDDDIDPSRIVPVIKDVNYIPEIRQSILDQGSSLDNWEDPAHEALNSELIVVYAEDSDTRMRFVSEQDLVDIGFGSDDRLERAVANLKALLPPLEARGGEGLYMLSAGGDYEASLLLFTKMWESGQLPVEGEIVVAVPARGILVVTGSEDAEGLASMRNIVVEATEVEVYTLTERLLVYRNGRFVLFE